MLEILDTTLRKGEQIPFVNFTVDEKVQIARMLDSVGVDMIETGDPSVVQNVANAIKCIASLGLQAEVVAHSVASRLSIDKEYPEISHHHLFSDILSNEACMLVSGLNAESVVFEPVHYSAPTLVGTRKANLWQLSSPPQ